MTRRSRRRMISDRHVLRTRNRSEVYPPRQGALPQPCCAHCADAIRDKRLSRMVRGCSAERFRALLVRLVRPAAYGALHGEQTMIALAMMSGTATTMLLIMVGY
jgi:hypothetical protein